MSAPHQCNVVLSASRSHASNWLALSAFQHLDLNLICALSSSPLFQLLPITRRFFRRVLIPTMIIDYVNAPVKSIYRSFANSVGIGTILVERS
jgi:hypothetical protein